MYKYNVITDTKHINEYVNMLKSIFIKFKLYGEKWQLNFEYLCRYRLAEIHKIKVDDKPITQIIVEYLFDLKYWRVEAKIIQNEMQVRKLFLTGFLNESKNGR